MKKLRFSQKPILFILFIFSINICLAGQYDKYKNELHTNRLALKDNAIWIAASKGLVKYDKALGKVSSASDELNVNSDIEYLSIAIAPDNSLWFVSTEEGIKKYDETLMKYGFQPYMDTFFGIIYAFAFDSQGRVFAGDFDYMLYVDNLNPIDEYYYCKQLYSFMNAYRGGDCSYRVLMDMTYDSKGDLWIIFDNREATIKDGENGVASFIKKNKEDIDELVKTIYYNPKLNFNATPILEFENINATSIVVDNEDNIWFTSDMGIHYYNQTTGKDSIINSTTHSAMPNEHFYANEKDSYGNIWFSSSKTLMKYDGEEFTTYTCPDYNEARSILCDGDIVWILLKNDTLLKFQNNAFEPIDLAPAVMGINESVIEAHKTKAYITNGELNIENEEGINSVVVYDAMGKVITSANANGATSTQIALPSNTKGLLIVKVNSEVIKVICN